MTSGAAFAVAGSASASAAESFAAAAPGLSIPDIPGRSWVSGWVDGSRADAGRELLLGSAAALAVGRHVVGRTVVQHMRDVGRCVAHPPADTKAAFKVGAATAARVVARGAAVAAVAAAVRGEVELEAAAAAARRWIRKCLMLVRGTSTALPPE